jgi:hypothetical protein
MRAHRTIFAPGLCTLFLASCALRTGVADTTQPHASADVITQTQIRLANAQTALEAVERLGHLRSRVRTPVSPTNARPQPAVYVDGLPLVRGLAGLADVRAATVHEIRFLSAPEATTRFGTGHEGGAILIVTVAQRPL